MAKNLDMTNSNSDSNNILKTILIILISCLISFFKINVISYITANIIKSIQENKIDGAYKFYKYFIIITVIYLILYYFYKFIQNKLLSKLKGNKISFVRISVKVSVIFTYR